jgi:hypothetical protein
VSTFVTGEQTLSGAQFAAIGDFTNLFIEFNANKAGFSPLDIAGLKGWYSADQGVTHSSGAVSQWNDLSGNAHHLVQATGTAQPTYSATSFNAKPGITFDGTADFMSKTSFALGATTDLTALIVLNIADVTTLSDRFLVYVGTGQANDYDNTASAALVTINPSAGQCTAFAGSVRGVVPVSASTNYRLVSRYDGANHTMYRNNVAGTTVATVPSYTSPGTFGVGAAWVGGSFNQAFGAATIAEILLYDSALSTGDMNALDAYLVAKWGL